ncbi:MAG UNVERIFIED_CONTAM: hypothetical protein LVT10_20870 [Anaerolineae bacterium]
MTAANAEVNALFEYFIISLHTSYMNRLLQYGNPSPFNHASRERSQLRRCKTQGVVFLHRHFYKEGQQA